MRLQEFFTRNAHPHVFIDVESEPDVQVLLDRFHVGVADIPVVICRGERVLKNPTNQEVADCFGLSVAIDSEVVRDLVVVGAGPGGLAAAVYGASEGLDVLVIEIERARRSGRHELEDRELPRLPDRHLRPGARRPRLHAGGEVRRRDRHRPQRHAPALFGRPHAHADALRRSNRQGARRHHRQRRAVPPPRRCPTSRSFEGVGIYYGATAIEARLCAGDEVVVVGGANSAGQAAVFLASETKHVHVLVRGAGLAETMSRYLIRRIEENPNITLVDRTPRSSASKATTA